MAAEYEVIVVGAGPAGAAVAARLAGRGAGVLLVDAAGMPRPKLCGCCLSAAALAELRLLAALRDADEGPLPAGTTPLTRVRLATASTAALVSLAGGGVVSREALDAAGVRRAIAAGAAWLPGTRVTAVREREAGTGRLAVEFAAATRRPIVVECEVVVVAAGLADSIRVGGGRGPTVAASRSGGAVGRLGIGTTLPAAAGGPPPGELLMAVSRRGYCGIVRLEDGRVDIAAALDRGGLAAAGGPAAAIASILAETSAEAAAGLTRSAIADLLASATFRGTPPLTRSQPVAAASGRILRIGDAAGYVEPFTGEGMGWALASARLLDEACGPALAGPVVTGLELAAAAARYARLHRRHFAARHARCRRVALAVRRPWLVGSAVRLARFAPAVAARVVPLVVGTASLQQERG